LANQGKNSADANVPAEDATIRVASIRGLTPLAKEAAAKAAVGLLAETPAPDVVGEVMQVFLNEKGGSSLLAASLSGAKLSEDTAKLALRSVTGSGREEPQLQAALREAGQLGSGPKVWAPAELAAILDTVSKEGNPARGEQVFRRAELSCVKCHAIGGAGGAVGPDLVSIGASAQLDYLLDSMTNPNKQVKENYNTVILALADGRVQTGIVTRKSATEIVLRDANDVEVAVPVSEIEEQSAGTSLMPAGLADGLTQTELADLIAFLSQLGKVGPYAPPSGAYAMRWEVLVPSDEAWTKLYRTSDTELLRQGANLGWKPAFSQVNGTLPLADLPAFRTRDRLAEKARQVMFLKTTAVVTTPGPARLILNDATGIDLWIDGESIPASQTTKVNWPTGNHTIHLAIDLQKRTGDVKLELSPEGSAQAKWQVKP
jgi:putative heme-binding domain-containing protein